MLVSAKRLPAKRNEKEIKSCNSKKWSVKHKGGRGGLRYKKGTNLAENKIAICPSLLVIISNAINGLNPSIRRLRMAE